ncbi:MAG: nucleotidyl transferase AbiEii/AbiGii toxin family protein [Endomicrobium sp.]|nr:nucleotidyl transferase AbiEii/AbiGii toxin family protein [Endomicrobium sp.]
MVKQCKTPFYLTGGTAISRGYYNHRYSDDLDFFVKNDLQYKNYVNAIIHALEQSGFYIDKNKDFIKAPVYKRLSQKTLEYNWIFLRKFCQGCLRRNLKKSIG